MTGSSELPKEVGRYLLFDVIASGGMASIHLGRLRGAAGFNKTVAVKRLHSHLLTEREFVTSFIDETRIASRIQHPNAVAVLDVLEHEDELYLVMEYVHGLSLSKLLRGAQSIGERPPLTVLVAIVMGALQGLHAAHEATDELGDPLHIVHRDVSPQNVIVGIDGTARILDFGIAKAQGRLTGTAMGVLKGKIGYMPPEQLLGTAEVTRSTDIYAMGVVLWEAIVGRRYVEGDSEAAQAINALKSQRQLIPPSHFVPGLPPQLDAIIVCATHPEPRQRFETARDMAFMLSSIPEVPPASASEVGAWAMSLAYEELGKRATVVRRVEAESNREIASAPAFDEGLVGPPSYRGGEYQQQQQQQQPHYPHQNHESGAHYHPSHQPLPVSSVRENPSTMGTPKPTSSTRRTGANDAEPYSRRGVTLGAVLGGTLATLIALAIAFVVTPKTTPLEQPLSLPATTPPIAASTAAVVSAAPSASASVAASASASATSSPSASVSASGAPSTSASSRRSPRK